MAVTANTRKNIIEWSQHFHRGKVLPEVKMLAQDNQILSDIPWVQCNDGTTHLYNVQTALPTISKSAFGEGAAESKSQKAKERESCTMLQGFSSVEAEMANIGGASGVVRAEEDENFAEAFKQTLSQMLIYANRGTNIRDFYGAATRMNSLTGTKAKNVISCGGVTANAQTSAYIFNWGKDAYGIFPEGTTAGLQKKDLGLRVKTLANGNQLPVLQTWHLWHVGLVVEAWPSLVRICNIDVANAQGLTGNQAPTSFSNVLHKIVQARLRIRRPGKKVCYVNDTVYGLMMRLAGEKSSAVLSWQKATTQFGEWMELLIYDMPVRRMDQILDTESVVA